jgi:sugar O-acyltransferase (sialic acid O-acetyltransferase NeuD family)
MKKLLIIGAGGHGRVCADIAHVMGKYSSIAFLDDAKPCVDLPYPLIGKCDMAAGLIDEYDLFIAIGNNETRQHMCKRFAGASYATLVHPSAIIGWNVSIGTGTVVMPGVIVNNHARIGDEVILNTGCSIDHDCTIADYCHISVGVNLCGNVSVGKHTWVGAGATVIHNIHICENCIIAAGAVVIDQITKEGLYVGVPCKRKSDYE